MTKQNTPPQTGGQAQPDRVFNIDQVVAYNLGQARRRKGWTQEQTAARLTAVTGTPWTGNGVGLAERSWATGRRRIFDATELLALSEAFGMPVARFLLPPDTGEPCEYVLGPQHSAKRIGRGRLLDHALARRARGEYRDLVEDATQAAETSQS